MALQQWVLFSYWLFINYTTQPLGNIHICVYMSQCTPEVRISDPIEVVRVWSHKLTCSERGFATCTFGHMCVFPTKRAWHHQSFAWWHGQWLGYLGMMLLLKEYKRAFAHGEGFQVADHERAQGLMQNHRVLWCIPALGLPGIWNQVGMCVLVYSSFMIVCQPPIKPQFLWHSFVWAAIEEVFPPQEDWSTRQQGPISIIGADLHLWLTIWEYPIADVPVTVLWHPWVGPKERASMSKCVFDWLCMNDLCWGLMVWILRVAIRKMSSWNTSFSPRGQHLCFGRVSLLVVCE